MEKILQPICITESMISTKSYTIPIDKENFIAILDKDNKLDFDDTLLGQLWKILGNDFASYAAYHVGHNIYIDVDMLNHDELIQKVQTCIDEYTAQARIESDFFSDGEE